MKGNFLSVAGHGLPMTWPLDSRLRENKEPDKVHPILSLQNHSIFLIIFSHDFKHGESISKLSLKCKVCISLFLENFRDTV